VIKHINTKLGEKGWAIPREEDTLDIYEALIVVPILAEDMLLQELYLYRPGPAAFLSTGHIIGAAAFILSDNYFP
jgi:hypothetical protein